VTCPSNTRVFVIINTTPILLRHVKREQRLSRFNRDIDMSLIHKVFIKQNICAECKRQQCCFVQKIATVKRLKSNPTIDTTSSRCSPVVSICEKLTRYSITRKWCSYNLFLTVMGVVNLIRRFSI
jgi:hypothetical protein